MEKSGLHGTFKLHGSITGGISLTDIRLHNEQISLTVDRVTPFYQLVEVYKGSIRGIAINGLHAELRLARKNQQPARADEKAAMDLEKLVRTLRGIRSEVIPPAIDLTNISVNASRDGKPLFSLAPSSLRHAAGDSSLSLHLGALTDATGREWAAQDSTLVWNENEISIHRIDPLPSLSVRELVVKLPEHGGPSAEAEVHLDDAVFMIDTSPGFVSVRADLREGSLPSSRVAERFGLDLPATASLTSLSVNADGLLPDPMAATCDVRITLEEVRTGDWSVPEISLDVGLEAGRATLASSGRMLGASFTGHAEMPLARDGGSFKPGELRGHFNVAEVSKLVAALAGRVKWIDPDAPVPPSMADGDFTADLTNMRVQGAGLTMVLKPSDPQLASSVFIKARWRKDQDVTASLEIEGMKAGVDYQLNSATYKAECAFDRFNSARIERWLDVVRAGPGVVMDLTGKWQGYGDLNKARHSGSVTLAQGEVARDDMPPVTASGEAAYDWPGSIHVKGLRVRTRDQTVSADAKLKDGLLEITGLTWLNGKTQIAGGGAKLPVPEDFAKWRDTLANDTRTVKVAVESEMLPLAMLKDWLPAAAKLDARSTGLLKLDVSGTYAMPEIDASLILKGLRPPDQPKLPPADLTLTLVGRDGSLSLSGIARAPDLPPAVMKASMPFRPAEWANKPGSILDENISARVDLPRIELSRFGSLVAAARKISGTVTGNIEVAGAVGKPVVKGRIDLAGGTLELKGDPIPPVTGLAATLDLTTTKITLSKLKAMVAGGTLQGSGLLAINSGKPGALVLDLTGNHLPLARNDSLILRANAALRLSGTIERAALTGKVGVVDSLFYRDIELLPIGSPFTAPSAAALPKIDAAAAHPGGLIPEPFRSWTINMAVNTENPFLIRGNLANGQVEANLRIGGTFGAPAPVGYVRVRDLKASLPFSTLAVRSGYARFSPATGLDPMLEIRGTAEPRPYRVNVYVYGSASNPQIVLTSNPPLPENEIMTLLATGTTTSGLENTQAASSRAMQLFAEEIRRGRFIGSKQLRPLLGMLDKVDFSLAEADPYSSDSFSTATLKLNDRWYLSAGMGGEGDSRVMGIWRISFR